MRRAAYSFRDTHPHWPGPGAGRVAGGQRAGGADRLRLAAVAPQAAAEFNMLERLIKELKRRTRGPGLFPNEASALRLVSAVAREISEGCETGRKYLAREPD